MEPGCESVGACLIPALWNGSEPAFFSPALETKPSVAVLARDFEVSPERVPSPLRGDSPFGNGIIASTASRLRPSRCGATISPASFGGGWGHQPHFPPPALRIDKGPITHPPPPLAIPAQRPELTSYGLADEVPKSSLFVTELKFSFLQTYVFFRAKITIRRAFDELFRASSANRASISVGRAFAPCPDDRS